MPVHFRAVDNAVETVKKVKEYVNNGFGVTLDVALDLEEVCKESERVKELEDTMLQYVEMEREMDHWVKAAELAKAEFNRQYDASSDNIPKIEEIFQRKLTEVSGKDYELNSHPKVKEFREKVWNIHHQGQPMPTAETQQGLEDEDIIMSQVPAEQTKCPLTLREMIKPMKSKICGHNYDHDAIMQHISRGRGRAKCPVCGQLLTKTDLEHNTVLEHSIKRKNRRK
ncbi:E3 SUMO-protein ligase NSE2-like [Orbicella faveolata]|uniref:E3 SUMO-protein ligase NSE2-like n=1 Tax=Orbicella faveolata TaxID=48498 RepID=UPI0009E41A81|nr:E3 SUMO-protein ligase NSE2-like [Orbicella faveolata]